DGAALCLRGKVRIKLNNDLLGATDDLKKSVRFGKDKFYYYMACILLADCLRNDGNFDYALKLYQECQIEQPDEAVALNGVGLCPRSKGPTDEAIQAFKDVLRVRPGDADARLQLAALYELKSEFPEALRFLKEIESTYPDDPQVLQQMSKIYYLLRDKKQAEE